jgi:hypothetical protein
MKEKRLFYNFYRWLATLNSEIEPVHDTIQMECCLNRKTYTVQQSLITVNFLWHFFTKSLPTIYQEKTANLRKLQHCITKATATVTKVMFVNTWHTIKYCFDMCGATNGAYIKTYWVTKKNWVLCYWILRPFPPYNKSFSIYKLFVFSHHSQTAGMTVPTNTNNLKEAPNHICYLVINQWNLFTSTPVKIASNFQNATHYNQ